MRFDMLLCKIRKNTDTRINQDYQKNHHTDINGSSVFDDFIISAAVQFLTPTRKRPGSLPGHFILNIASIVCRKALACCM